MIKARRNPHVQTLDDLVLFWVLVAGSRKVSRVRNNILKDRDFEIVVSIPTGATALMSPQQEIELALKAAPFICGMAPPCTRSARRL